MQPQLQALPARQGRGLHSNRFDGSTAAGSHGAGSSDDNRNTRRRFDSFSNPDDENARSAVLLRFPCEQCDAGVSARLKKSLTTANVPTANMPVRIHCKTGTASARLVFETRTKCQDFVARFKDDGLPNTVDSTFCSTRATIIVRQSKSPEDREIGRSFLTALGSSGSETSRKIPW